MVDLPHAVLLLVIVRRAGGIATMLDYKTADRSSSIARYVHAPSCCRR
jgi:hypothetical protein